MGWNSAYTIIEAQVVNVYNLGKLDKETLKAMISPFQGTDIDSGGSRDLKTKDGKSFEDIVIEMLCPKSTYNKLLKLRKQAIEYKVDDNIFKEFSELKGKYSSEEEHEKAKDIYWTLQDLEHDAFRASTKW